MGSCKSDTGNGLGFDMDQGTSTILPKVLASITA